MLGSVFVCGATAVDVVGLFGMGRPSNEERTQRQRALNDKQLTFAVWFATPVGVREPRTLEDVAQVLGVDRSTVWRWSRDPRVLDASRYVVLQNAGEPGKVTQVLDMIHSVAVENRDVKFAELWLKAVGVLAAATNRDVSLWDAVQEDSLDRLSDAELERLKRVREAERQAAEDEAAAVARAGQVLNDGS
jgi:hypothetical protein